VAYDPLNPSASDDDAEGFTLPPRAGAGTLMGLRASDWIGMLGGLLSGVRIGSPQARAHGGGLSPGLALFPLAQGLEASDRQARSAEGVKALQSQYGDMTDLPEFRTAMLLAQQGNWKDAMPLLSKGITDRNTRARDALKVEREGQAGIDATNLMGNIQVPQITSMRPAESPSPDTGALSLGTGETLTLPPPIEDFLTQARPRTTDEMVKGLQALPPERQGLAAASLRSALEKQREKDSDRVRDAGDAREAIKALGGPKALYTASPEELESATMMLAPGSKFGARLSIIANHRRAGDAKKDAQATREADTLWRRDYLTSQADQRAQGIQFQQEFKTSEASRRASDAEDRRQAAADRLQLGRDALDAKVREWGTRAGERQGKLGASEQKTVQALAVMDHWVNQAEGVLKEMSDAKLLPGGEGAGSSATAWTRRQLKPNADALRKWQALQPGVVGFDRSVLNDMGARAIKAHSGALQFFDSPPTYEGAQAVLKQMREQLEVAKSTVPSLIRKQQIRDQLAPEDGRPAGPEMPPARPPAPSPGAPTSGPPPSLYVGGAPGRIIQPDMPTSPPPAGMVWVKNPLGEWGAWDAKKPIPQGFKR
jgi:hypothetical protein